MFIRSLVFLFVAIAGTILADTWTVQITSNSNAIGEQNGSDYVIGLQTGGVIYWSATINATHPNATVMADTGNAIVTFKKGIVINYLDNEGVLFGYGFQL